jgi:hypothetical protein
MENQAKNQEIEGAVLTGGEGARPAGGSQRVLRGLPARPSGAAGASCGDEAARPVRTRWRVLRVAAGASCGGPAGDAAARPVGDAAARLAWEEEGATGETRNRIFFIF